MLIKVFTFCLSIIFNEKHRHEKVFRSWLLYPNLNYLPISEHGGPSVQTAPEVKVCRMDTDGGNGSSGSGGLK